MTLSLFVAALLGALSWSLLEYVIHRWLGHDKRLRPNLFADEHIAHHSKGNYFAPGYKKAAAAAVFLALIAPPAVLIAGWAHGLTYAIGTVGFYLYYELLHRREHTHEGFSFYGRWARRHHFYHHFVDPSMNHGVTSPLWDLVFGTYRAPEKIRVPRKLCMGWLLDPASGDVRARYREHYEMRRAAT